MKRYEIIDTRDSIGKWSVVDNKKRMKNIWNWRKSIVKTGYKKDCRKFIMRKYKR